MISKSYTCGTGDIPLTGLTIGEKFDEIFKKYPDNEALVVHHQDLRLTYRQLKELVDQCALGLLSLEIDKGDRIGIWSSNRSEWTVLQLASAKIGAVLVNINPSYRTHELEYALNQSGCKLIVIEDKFKYSDYHAMVCELAPELKTHQPGDLNAKRLPNLKLVVSLAENPPSGMMTWNTLLGRAGRVAISRLEERSSQLSFDDPINIQYTSGTTGNPKGATLSHHNILNNAIFVTRRMRYTNEERVIIPVPLYHCFGMVLGNLGCLVNGATMIYPDNGFDPKAVLEAVQREKATVLFGVPTMFIAELEHPEFCEYDLSSLRTGIMGGSPCPVEIMKKVKSVMHMNDIQVAYGMTETSPVVTQTEMGATLEKQVGTVGQVHPHVEIKIIDPESGLVLPVGEAGELCMRGYSVMLGYWNDEIQTRQAIDRAGWMHSQDLATIDGEGYIKIVGRIKDMIIRGGENIYPKEIEEFLFSHPKIAQVQVIGVPDIKYGEAVMAWIQPKDGETLNNEEVQDYCKGKIAHFKIPAYFKFTDDFPMTVTGKIRKVEMREISIRELDLSEASNVKTA